jgi:autotransporter strand-loop-strand O-heptosyltransferase
MPDFTINPAFGAMGAGNYSLNVGAAPAATAPTAAAPAATAPTAAAPAKSTGDPDLAPGQKRPEGAQKSIYGEIPQIPVLDAVDGIKFDFNHGIRILFPHNGKTYHVTFMDIDTGVILYSNDTVPGAFITSVKKFYIRFRLMIHEKGNDTPIFQHDMDLTDKEVMVQLPVGTIGDSIGWFSYVERCQLKHKCKLICVMTPWIATLVKDQYPNITFIAPEETVKFRPYASYYMGLFFRGDVDNQPIDFRYIGLHRTAGWILGVDPEEVPPRFDLSAPRQIEEPYVCIAVQSSSQAKYWNNPQGWHDVVKFLKDSGYRVLCMDRDRVHGQGLVWNHIPHGCEDFTGNRPLQERINIIKDADFFIGVSSGLSWLAWGCQVPVVMISGFTNPTNEFYTPYRVINFHTCNSCWNDMRVDFDHFDFLWCPRHKGDPQHFECTRVISAQQVINVIKTIPTFRE